MKALVTAGYGCNNRCAFCHTLDAREVNRTAAEVDGLIDRAARLGHTMVVLTGGEVTTRAELFHWAARTAARGMDFGLVTNGRMLAYPAVVDRLLAARLRLVELSLHGGTAAVHDAIVRAEAFGQTVQALRNLAGRGLALTVHAVVTRHNVLHLRALVDTVLPFADVTLRFSMAYATVGDPARGEFTPTVAEVAARVSDAIGYGLARSGGRGPAFTHEGIPLCLVPEHTDRQEDLRARGYVTRAAPADTDLVPVHPPVRVHPRGVCDGCALRGACPGLHPDDPAVGDPRVLRPVTAQPRSNSFHYVYEATAGALTGDDTDVTGCPVWRDGPSPWDRGRVLFVRRGRQVGRFRTPTRDFTDEEITATTHLHGQVYLDVSGKPAPDDFARDLVQLRRSDRCAPCPARDACAGLYEPSPGDPFTRDDARVREILAGLTGDVLDVGCGEGPYAEVLAARAATGALRYVGLDPDAQRVNLLRARWPWAEVRVAAAEDLDPAGSERFDHVLVLRSWNHLRDPVRAVAVLAALLRPGGTVTVVDNVAFGLVRGRRAAARAERGPAGFEHYRNDGVAEAAAVLGSTGFACIARQDLSPATSNQWLLRYRAGP